MEFCVTVTLWDPDAPSEPLQEPEALHDVAFVDDQFRVIDPLTATSMTELVSITVGGVLETEPPPPPPPPQPASAATDSPSAASTTRNFIVIPCFFVLADHDDRERLP